MGGFTISKQQKRLVNMVLNSTRLSYGPMTQKFENMWGNLHDTKYAIFCNSGTSALKVALHAMKDKYGWNDGDEVIIPALTFVATMNVVLHNNLTPVFVDIEKDYYNIDPTKIEDVISHKTKAIIAVHLLGQPAQMDKIMRIAKKYHLKVIEDSCETVGVSYKGKKVGSWGDVGCFSTYASHLIVTGVGGFACTNNADLAIRMKGLFNHGRDGIYHSIDDNKKGTAIMKSRFNFIHSGYSDRLTEMESALGIGHLERFPQELKKRQLNAKKLLKGLKPLEDAGWISLPRIHPNAEHSWMLFGLVAKDRDRVIVELEKKGIATRYMMPLTTQPIFKKLFGDVKGQYPVNDNCNDNAFLIGLNPNMVDADIKYIVKVFKEVYA